MDYFGLRVATVTGEKAFHVNFLTSGLLTCVQNFLRSKISSYSESTQNGSLIGHVKVSLVDITTRFYSPFPHACPRHEDEAS